MGPVRGTLNNEDFDRIVARYLQSSFPRKDGLLSSHGLVLLHCPTTLESLRGHAICHANADSGQGRTRPCVGPSILPPSPILHSSYRQHA